MSKNCDELIEKVLADTDAVPDEQQAAILREGRMNLARTRFLAAVNFKLARTHEEGQAFAEQVEQADMAYQQAGKYLAAIEARIEAKKRSVPSQEAVAG